MLCINLSEYVLDKCDKEKNVPLAYNERAHLFDEKFQLTTFNVWLTLPGTHFGKFSRLQKLFENLPEFVSGPLPTQKKLVWVYTIIIMRYSILYSIVSK